jgi:hypothetical protein
VDTAGQDQRKQNDRRIILAGKISEKLAGMILRTELMKNVGTHHWREVWKI